MAEWKEIFGNWVLVPPHPRAVVHFLGGAFVAAAPQLSYRSLLEAIAEDGYVVIATPFVNTLDHRAIAHQVWDSFEKTLGHVRSRLIRNQYLPLYGLGHSMGCKLHLLIGSEFPQDRAGNILISFNNYPLRKAVPLGEQMAQLTTQFSTQFSAQISQLSTQFAQFMPNLAPAMEAEFTPSPAETNRLIADHYPVKRNLLLKFTNDTIDQTRPLHDILRVRFPDMTAVKILKGTHLTPLGQDLKWQPGQSFTPFDAMGQMMNQTFNQDFYRLQSTLLQWLDPTR